MGALRDRLRTLPGFPPDLPVLDVENLPESPGDLFLSWLDAAIDSGSRQPHAMALVTAREDATPVGRTLILKDIDHYGYHFSTHRSSRKGRELAENPRASMIFFWRESGRQVRITGAVQMLGEEASQNDWEARPNYDGTPNPDWQLYALDPDEFEFLQAREDRNHTRIEYRRASTGEWAHGRVTTPAG